MRTNKPQTVSTVHIREVTGSSPVVPIFTRQTRGKLAPFGFILEQSGHFADRPYSPCYSCQTRGKLTPFGFILEQGGHFADHHRLTL